MAFSPVGKTKLIAHLFLLLITIIVLALSTQVNRFQDFFYVADLFPLALSIVTLVLLSSTTALDLAIDDAFTGRPQIEIGLLGILSILWLAFNSFSTSRWRMVPFQCSSIPLAFVDERTWCNNLQALKAFVWIEFLTCFAIAMFTLRYSLAQYNRGNKHIFKTSFSRYRPEVGAGETPSFARDSEFLQFEKLTHMVSR